jgi:hypothetical protein
MIYASQNSQKNFVSGLEDTPLATPGHTVSEFLLLVCTVGVQKRNVDLQRPHSRPVAAEEIVVIAQFNMLRSGQWLGRDDQNVHFLPSQIMFGIPFTPRQQC